MSIEHILENNRSCEHNFGNNRQEKKEEFPESIIGTFWSIIDLSLVPISISVTRNKDCFQKEIES